MSFNFALKDFYRKRDQTFPYVLIIMLVIALLEFLIYFTSTLSLDVINQYGFTTVTNQYYFKGGINKVYSEFNALLIILVVFLAFVIIIVVTTTLVSHKGRDIAIMKALGTIPQKLYGFYILEVYIIFLIGFGLGLILGFISYWIFAFIMYFLGYPITFNLDFIYTPILFVVCVIGIYVITGYKLRKITDEKIVMTFSEDIPYDYVADKGVPRWLNSLGMHFKIAFLNTKRRSKEFRRYLIIFTVIFVILFTLGLGTIALGNSSREWINKAQGENIIIIGHKDTVFYYSQMYRMFSNPSITIDEKDIDFIKPKYLFNSSDLNELQNVSTIEKIDERLISFCYAEELNGTRYTYDPNLDPGIYAPPPSSGYENVGQERNGTYPFIGVKPKKVIQNFEIIGEFFNSTSYVSRMVIGDGLGLNFFDSPFDQQLKIPSQDIKLQISGVIIDSFYCGYVGYLDLEFFREKLNLSSSEAVNIVVIKFQEGKYSSVKKDLERIIHNSLGNDFTYKRMDDIFQDNLEYILALTWYPFLLIFIMSFVALTSLYNYQKAGIMQKSKDFLIMRSIGARDKSIRRVIFLEALFVLIPALLYSLALGMIINTIILIDRVVLPPLYVPLLFMGVMFSFLLILTHLSLKPIMKKVKQFTIKDFEIY